MLKRDLMFFGFILFFMSELSQATCVVRNGGLPSGNSGNPVRVGSKTDLMIYREVYQPIGTLLAYEYISPSNISGQTGIPLDRVLFQCDLTDKDSIYEMYYMPPGIINNNAPRLTLAGIRYWSTNMTGMMFNFFIGSNTDTTTQFNNAVQRKKLTGYDIDSINPNKINITLKHFSGISINQVRSDQAVNSNAYLSQVGIVSRGVFGFSGPGLNPGTTFSAANSYTNLAQRVIGGRVINACGINQVTSVVNLGQHSATSLPSTPANFSVTLECQRGATKVKYGFAPNEENRVNNEQNYLLLDPDLGSTAKGVAIEILNSVGGRVKVLSLGTLGNGIPITNNNWIAVPVQTGSGTQIITLNFSARYVKYPPEIIKPGKANSKAIFMIDMQ
ncbi:MULTISPECIES: fimbrial protein [unclassified Providencia]|uniref:fimbrial protein n=2 Tax=Providencia TaxID=586 RepID=UPI000E942A64|nr:fimbrial protein [Providencia sp.]HBO22885.1 type 1 fimbrial protein [Providencia sp.]